MKKLLAIIASLVVISAVVFSANVDKVLGTTSSLSWTGSGITKIASFTTATPASWTPQYAIRMGLTNRSEYTDSGLYVQQGWDVRMLVNIRSNPALNQLTGCGLSGSLFRFGSASGSPTSFNAYYGPSFATSAAGSKTTGWVFIRMAGVGMTGTLYTNGVAIAAYTSPAGYPTNTTVRFQVGTYAAGGNGITWDIARVQLIDGVGTLQKDLIATANGTFSNVSDGAISTFGVGGVGGTSLDSTNVAGQAFPPQTWQ